MPKKRKILSRSDAIAKGKTVFFTGKVCRNGHTDYRYTSTGHCLECLRLRAADVRVAIKKGRERAISHG